MQDLFCQALCMKQSPNIYQMMSD